VAEETVTKEAETVTKAEETAKEEETVTKEAEENAAVAGGAEGEASAVSGTPPPRFHRRGRLLEADAGC
jgi:hypothetical protein